MTGIMEGKVVIITGAASGIGRATAQIYAREGARVIIADVNERGGEETLSMINKQGHQGLFVRTDMTVETDVKTLVDRAMNAHGRLDAAFNNAGIEGMQASSADMPTNEFDKIIAVNLKGVYLCMKYQIPAMLKGGGGAIVNTASVAGLVGFPGLGAYVASKHGVIGLTKTAALEYAKAGIRVNCVCPGLIDTPMVGRLGGSDPAMVAGLVAAEPVGRLGRPSEIGEAAVWLCSDHASFVTGHSMVVDGGLVAQ
ncbi:MAG: SDR family oxidoreductase [Alphaproteobacteria bacterium]|jgi:NAD(P)-dependent dehydrogenase (short-subunit alcohol dehydrogenase family)